MVNIINKWYHYIKVYKGHILIFQYWEAREVKFETVMGWKRWRATKETGKGTVTAMCCFKSLFSPIASVLTLTPGFHLNDFKLTVDWNSLGYMKTCQVNYKKNSKGKWHIWTPTQGLANTLRIIMLSSVQGSKFTNWFFSFARQVRKHARMSRDKSRRTKSKGLIMTSALVIWKDHKPKGEKTDTADSWELEVTLSCCSVSS